MNRQEMRQRIFDQRATPANIRGVCSTDRVDQIIPSCRLGEAIVIVAKGVEGYLTSGAVVFFGDDRSLNYQECRDMFDCFGHRLVSD